MAFTLPKYSELTDQQKIVAGQDYDKNVLVSAPPGTGKTVIALYRAKEMSDSGRKIAILVYNRPLMLYIKSVAERIGIKAEINTWHSWLVSFYKNQFKTDYPKENGENFTYDWDRINYDFERWGARNNYYKYDAMIFDESQDFPIPFIRAVKNITKCVNCMMDDKQKIVTEGSDISDIADVLDVMNYFTLYQNFRNSEEIYRLSQVYRDDEADPRFRSNELPHFIRDYGWGIPLEKICDIVRRRSLPYIGIFAKFTQVKKIYEELTENFPGRNIFYIKSQSECNFKDFTREGIYIMSFNVMKGLEFDEVIVPRFDHIDATGDSSVDKNLIYVAITRASHYFYGVYQSNKANTGCIDSLGPFRNGTADKSVARWE